MVGKKGSTLVFCPMETLLSPSVEKQPDVTLGMWLLFDAECILGMVVG